MQKPFHIIGISLILLSSAAISAETKEYKKTSEGIRKLDKMQEYVTQHNGTETPFHNEYWNFWEEGIYVDVVSGEPLFSSTDKIKADHGWPSFSKPIKDNFILEKSDTTQSMNRTEVRSRNADSHLGHVFDDGPVETGGRRFCINSSALRFIPKDRLIDEGYIEYLFLFDKK